MFSVLIDAAVWSMQVLKGEEVYSYREKCPRPFLVIALMETLKSVSPSCIV